MDTSESRLVPLTEYPVMAYAEALVFFFGANFIFHQNVFRRVNSRP